MSISGRTAWIFLWTLCSLLLLVLVGETPAGVLVMSLGCLGVALSGIRWRAERLPADSAWWVFWGSYLGLTCLSALTSESWLLTINKIIPIAFSFMLASTWWLMDRRWLNTQLLALGTVLLGIVLASMTLLLFALPSLAELLPSMNLLIATYGHNHANIIFVMCLPLAWKVWRVQEKEWWSFLPLALILLGIVLSFGRVAMVIALGQILWLAYQEFGRTRWPKIAQGIVAVLGICLIFFGALSLWPGIKDPQSCPLPVLKIQLCKVLRSEGRPAYWQQAIAGIRARPLTGWGVNTFHIVSGKFQKSLDEFSSYPHNEYLQWLVEYGVVGGGWLLLSASWLAVHVVRVLRTEEKNTWRAMLGIAVVSVWIDALFNYNWSYVSVWTMFMILTASVLRADGKKNQQQLAKNQQLLLRGWFGMMVMMVIVWGGAYAASTWWWRHGQYDHALTLYPFVYWRVEDSLMGKYAIQPQTRAQLLRWYGSNERMVRYAALGTSDPAELKLLHERSVELQPLNVFPRIKLWRVAVDEQNGREALKQGLALETLLPGEKWWQIQQQDSYLFGDTIRLINSFASTNSESGAGLMALMMRHLPWAIRHETSIAVFQTPEKYPPETVKFFLDAWGSEDMWPYEGSLSQWWEVEMRTSIQKMEFERGSEVLEQYMQHMPSKKNNAWKVISEESKNAIKREPSAEAKRRAVGAWSEYLRALNKHGDANEVLEWQSKKELERALVAQANTDLLVDAEQSLEFYSRALEINPQLSSNYSLAYLSSTQDPETLDGWVDTVAKHDAKNLFVLSSENLRFLQRMATRAGERGADHEAEWLLRVLRQLSPQDYWISAQLGNYWYWRAEQVKDSDPAQAEAWWAKAQTEYEKCLASFERPAQTQCEWGLRSLNEKWHDGADKYTQAEYRILKY